MPKLLERLTDWNLAVRVEHALSGIEISYKEDYLEDYREFGRLEHRSLFLTQRAIREDFTAFLKDVLAGRGIDREDMG